VPIGLVLIFLTGAGPLFAWRRTTVASLRKNFALPVAVGLAMAGIVAALGVRDFYALVSFVLCAFVVAAIGLEFHQGTRARMRSTDESYGQALYRLSSKSRRRYGGYLVHLAMIMLFVGFTGKAFTVEKEFVLEYGQSFQVQDYTFTYEALAHSEDANRTVDAAAVTLSQAGEFLSTMIPERHFYKSFEQGTTEVSIYSRLREDIYLILVGYSQGGQSAKFQVYLNPLVNWVWMGGVVFVLGSLWAMWPTARDRRLAKLDRRSFQDPANALSAPNAGSGAPS